MVVCSYNISFLFLPYLGINKVTVEKVLPPFRQKQYLQAANLDTNKEALLLGELRVNWIITKILRRYLGT